MKRIQLMLLLILSILLLTACYTDHDPWPVDGSLTVQTSSPAATASPVPTAAPEATLAPTAVPEGNSEPGING